MGAARLLSASRTIFIDRSTSRIYSGWTRELAFSPNYFWSARIETTLVTTTSLWVLYGLLWKCKREKLKKTWNSSQVYSFLDFQMDSKRIEQNLKVCTSHLRKEDDGHNNVPELDLHKLFEEKKNGMLAGHKKDAFYTIVQLNCKGLRWSASFPLKHVFHAFKLEWQVNTLAGQAKD